VSLNIGYGKPAAENSPAGFLCLVVLGMVLAGSGGCLAAAVPSEPQRCGFPQRLEWWQRGEHLLSERPQLPFVWETPDGRFRFHYALEGPNAVPAEDADGNGVPDYVDTAAAFLNLVWRVLVDTLGFPPPPPDMGAGGSEAYDIYFVNLAPEGLYGETVPERLLPSGSGLPRFTSFLRVDNDYSPADSFQGRQLYYESGIRALRIALAHEFGHAIQFGKYGITRRGTLLYELYSTYLEWRVFPDTRDYEQFLPELFQKPESCVFGRADDGWLGYRFALFGQHVYLRYGDEPWRQMWELIERGIHPYAALDSALRLRCQTSLAEVWCGFVEWLYYTGERARPGYFPQERARHYPMVRFAWSERFAPPRQMCSGELQPFEFRFLRIVFPSRGATPDTLDVGLSNPDLAAVVGAIARRSGYVFLCGSDVEGEPLPGTPYRVRLEDPQQRLCSVRFWNTGVPVELLAEPFPQPYVPGEHERVCFPLPQESEGAAPELELFTTAMAPVLQRSLRVERVEHWLSGCIELPALPPGMYLFRVRAAGAEVWGKLLVKGSP
jgi:hypothetical protein